MTSSKIPEPSFPRWLARNPTGIPCSEALRRALAGTALAGLCSLAIARARRPALPPAFAARTLGVAALGGALTPFCVTATTYALDRTLLRGDELLGFSGVMRELLHAGELSVLGALGAGLAHSAATRGQGVLLSTGGTALVGTTLYAVRGFGPGLGVGAGLLSGLFGGSSAGSLPHAPLAANCSNPTLHASFQCGAHALPKPAQPLHWLVGEHEAHIARACRTAPVDHRRRRDAAPLEQAS